MRERLRSALGGLKVREVVVHVAPTVHDARSLPSSEDCE